MVVAEAQATAALPGSPDTLSDRPVRGSDSGGDGGEDGGHGSKVPKSRSPDGKPPLAPQGSPTLGHKVAAISGDDADRLVREAGRASANFKYDKAIRTLQKVISHESRTGGNAVRLAIALDATAAAERLQGNYEKALERYKQCFDTTTKLVSGDDEGADYGSSGNRALHLSAINNLAAMQRRLGQYQAAGELHVKCLQDRIMTQDAIMIARSLNNAALVDIDLGYYGSAQEMLEQCQDLLAKGPRQYWARRVGRLSLGGERSQAYIVPALRGVVVVNDDFKMLGKEGSLQASYRAPIRDVAYSTYESLVAVAERGHGGRIVVSLASQGPGESVALPELAVWQLGQSVEAVAVSLVPERRGVVWATVHRATGEMELSVGQIPSLAETDGPAPPVTVPLAPLPKRCIAVNLATTFTTSGRILIALSAQNCAQPLLTPSGKTEEPTARTGHLLFISLDNTGSPSVSAWEGSSDGFLPECLSWTSTMSLAVGCRDGSVVIISHDGPISTTTTQPHKLRGTGGDSHGISTLIPWRCPFDSEGFLAGDRNGTIYACGQAPSSEGLTVQVSALLEPLMAIRDITLMRVDGAAAARAMCVLDDGRIFAVTLPTSQSHVAAKSPWAPTVQYMTSQGHFLPDPPPQPQAGKTAMSNDDAGIEEATLRSVQGWLGLEKGSYVTAGEDFRRAVTAYESTLGPSHPDTTEARLGFATAMDCVGDYTTARNIYEQCLATTQSTLGTRHPLYAAALNGLGSVNQSEGNTESAMENYQQSAQVYRGVLGERHPTLATVLNNIASIHVENEEYDEALRLYTQCLETETAALGSIHPHCARTLNNRARTLEATGQLEDARLEYQKCIDALERTVGVHSAHYNTVLANQAYLNVELGNFAEAMVLYETAERLLATRLQPILQSKATSLSLESIHELMAYVDILRHLGQACYEDGNEDDALNWFLKCRDTYELFVWKSTNLSSEVVSAAAHTGLPNGMSRPRLNSGAYDYQEDVEHDSHDDASVRSVPEIAEEAGGVPEDDDAVVIGDIEGLRSRQETASVGAAAGDIKPNESLGPREAEEALDDYESVLGDIAVLQEKQGDMKDALATHEKRLLVFDGRLRQTATQPKPSRQPSDISPEAPPDMAGPTLDSSFDEANGSMRIRKLGPTDTFGMDSFSRTNSRSGEMALRRARVYNSISYVYLTMGRLDLAHQYFNENIDLCAQYLTGGAVAAAVVAQSTPSPALRHSAAHSPQDSFSLDKSSPIIGVPVGSSIPVPSPPSSPSPPNRRLGSRSGSLNGRATPVPLHHQSSSSSVGVLQRVGPDVMDLVKNAARSNELVATTFATALEGLGTLAFKKNEYMRAMECFQSVLSIYEQQQGAVSPQSSGRDVSMGGKGSGLRSPRRTTLTSRSPGIAIKRLLNHVLALHEERALLAVEEHDHSPALTHYNVCVQIITDQNLDSLVRNADINDDDDLVGGERALNEIKLSKLGHDFERLERLLRILVAKAAVIEKQGNYSAATDLCAEIRSIIERSVEEILVEGVHPDIALIHSEARNMIKRDKILAEYRVGLRQVYLYLHARYDEIKGVFTAFCEPFPADNDFGDNAENASANVMHTDAFKRFVEEAKLAGDDQTGPPYVTAFVDDLRQRAVRALGDDPRDDDSSLDEGADDQLTLPMFIMSLLFFAHEKYHEELDILSIDKVKSMFEGHIIGVAHSEGPHSGPVNVDTPPSLLRNMKIIEDIESKVRSVDTRTQAPLGRQDNDAAESSADDGEDDDDDYDDEWEENEVEEAWYTSESESSEGTNLEDPDEEVGVDIDGVELDDGAIPHHFKCPITQELMTFPVVAVDGQTYDRQSIRKWFRRSRRSPLTGLRLRRIFIPNYNLKSQISDFVDTERERQTATNTSQSGSLPRALDFSAELSTSQNVHQDASTTAPSDTDLSVDRSRYFNNSRASAQSEGAESSSTSRHRQSRTTSARHRIMERFRLEAGLLSRALRVATDVSDDAVPGSSDCPIHKAAPLEPMNESSECTCAVEQVSYWRSLCHSLRHRTARVDLAGWSEPGRVKELFEKCNAAELLETDLFNWIESRLGEGKDCKVLRHSPQEIAGSLGEPNAADVVAWTYIDVPTLPAVRKLPACAHTLTHLGMDTCQVFIELEGSLVISVDSSSTFNSDESKELLESLCNIATMDPGLVAYARAIARTHVQPRAADDDSSPIATTDGAEKEEKAADTVPNSVGTDEEATPRSSNGGSQPQSSGTRSDSSFGALFPAGICHDLGEVARELLRKRVMCQRVVSAQSLGVGAAVIEMTVTGPAGWLATRVENEERIRRGPDAGIADDVNSVGALQDGELWWMPRCLVPVDFDHDRYGEAQVKSCLSKLGIPAGDVMSVSRRDDATHKRSVKFNEEADPDDENEEGFDISIRVFPYHVECVTSGWTESVSRGLNLSDNERLVRHRPSGLVETDITGTVDVKWIAGEDVSCLPGHAAASDAICRVSCELELAELIQQADRTPAPSAPPAPAVLAEYRNEVRKLLGLAAQGHDGERSKDEIMEELGSVPINQLSLSSDDHDKALCIIAWDEIAAHHISKKEPSKAMKYYQRIVDSTSNMDRPDLSETYARAIASMAGVHRSLKDHSESEKHYTRAREVCRANKLQSTSVYHDILYDFAGVSCLLAKERKDEPETAETHGQAALDALQELRGLLGKNHSKYLSTLHLTARVARLVKDGKVVAQVEKEFASAVAGLSSPVK